MGWGEAVRLLVLVLVLRGSLASNARHGRCTHSCLLDQAAPALAVLSPQPQPQHPMP